MNVVKTENVPRLTEVSVWDAQSSVVKVHMFT